MSFPPDKVGDKGQRYEIRVRDPETGEDFVIGWGNKSTSFIEAIAAHPGWRRKIRVVIDRKTGEETTEEE